MIINDTETIKTDVLSINGSEIIEINKIFSFESIKLTSINFLILEEFSDNVVLKGISNYQTSDINPYTSNECALSDTNGKSIILIKFNIYISSNDETDHYFQNKLQTNKSKTEQGMLTKIKDIATFSNAENFQNFILNMRYPIFLLKIVLSMINWENYKNTLLFLVSFSFIIIYPRTFLFFCPLLFIFIHFCFRKSFANMIIDKSQINNIDGIDFISKIIDATNTSLKLFEDFISLLSKTEGLPAEELYLEICKIGALIFCLLSTDFIFNINYLIVILIVTWMIFLYNNNHVYVFVMFMNVLLMKRLVNPTITKFNVCFPRTYSYVDSFVKRVIKMSFLVIPFFFIFKKLEEESIQTVGNDLREQNSFRKSDKNIKKLEISDIFDKLKESTQITDFGKNMKFCIFENERWWMIVGWAKNLVLNEAPLWSDVSMKRYVDKSTVLLPNDNYDWDGNWNIDLSTSSDNQGWEYASDFKSVFGPSSFGKYVRRRKWIRIAKLKENK